MATTGAVVSVVSKESVPSLKRLLTWQCTWRFSVCDEIEGMIIGIERLFEAGVGVEEDGTWRR